MATPNLPLTSSTEGQLNTACQAAYLELLVSMPPHRRHTLSGQALLTQLRNAIARCTGNEDQYIQSLFEEKAANILRGLNT